MRFEVKFKQTDKAFDARFNHFQKVIERPAVAIYTGSYDVTPMVEPQSLETKEKLMTDDVRINQIPYYEVGNTSGGSTVYIGTLEELLGKT